MSSFHEVQFPEDISYGSQGGPGFRTSIVETDSGQEQRTSRWDIARRSYDARWAIQALEDVYKVLEFYIARRGPAYGFRFKDWTDYATTPNGLCTNSVDVSPTDEILGVGNDALTQFQLVKRYVSGPTIRTRNLTKPRAGTVRVSFNDVEQLTGWTVDTTTGIITFTVPVPNGVTVKAGCRFDVPVRFGDEVDQSLRASINGFNNGEIGSIPLVEILDGLAVTDERILGGSLEFVSEADWTFNRSAAFWVVDAQASGLKGLLQDPTTVPDGGVIYTIANDGANAFDVADHLGTVLTTLAVGSKVEVYLSHDGVGGYTWYLL